MKTTQTKPEIFFVKSDEIQGRFDPYFYRPEFLEMEKTFEKSKWDIKKLGEIASFQYGLGEVAEDSGDLIYLRITDIDGNGNLKKDGLKYLNNKESFNNYILNKGDILVARTGATFGKTFYFNEDFNATFGGFLIRIKLNENVLSKFYFYFAQTNIYWNLANRLVSGGGQQQFNANTIYDLKIPIPPKEIQKQIIDLMDNAYNLKKQNEQEARELIESVDDYVLTELGIKIPKTEEKMFFIVGSNELKNNRIDTEYHQEKYKEIQKALENGKYELKKLKDVCKKINSGSTPKAKGESYLEQGENYFIRISDFNNMKISLTNALFIDDETHNKELKRSQLQKGDILFGIAGTIGVTALFNHNIKANINQAVAILRVKEKLFNEYLLYILNSKIIKFYSERNKRPTGVPNMNLEELSNLQIPLPPLKIQEKIAKEVKSRLEKAEKLKQEAKENLERAKQEVEKILLG